MVEEVNLFRERKTGKSKGCGFVTMQTRDQALKAIETMEGEPEVGRRVFERAWNEERLRVCVSCLYRASVVVGLGCPLHV